MFLEYESYFWIIWCLITFCFAKRLGYLGLFIAHLIVLISIAISDIYLMSEFMKNPEWDGTPDMDILFFLGIIFRVIIINTCLLPIGLIGKHLGKRFKVT